MNDNTSKVREALARINKGLETISTDEDWIKFLRFQSTFYNYSFGNTMLIFLQNPDATYVHGFVAWNALGRHVRRGEKGIAIIAPCTRKVTEFVEPEDTSIFNDQEGEKQEKRVLSGFKITHVFDISQTVGDDSKLPVLVRGISGNGDDVKMLYEKLRTHISKELPVKEVKGRAKGSYDPKHHCIRINPDLEAAQKVKTLIHEYAHSIDFTMNPSPDIARNKRELVAESVAFIVSLNLGVDAEAYSMGYLKTWLKDRNELKEIADIVQRIAAQIINGLADSGDPAFENILQED